MNQDLIWKTEDVVAYHKRQFVEPFRSTVHLARFMKRLDLPAQADVLDVACGAGATIHYLSREFPGFRWTGVDYVGESLFSIGRNHLDAASVPVTLVTGDLYKLIDLFPGRVFDIVMSVQTLSWLPDYRLALEQLLAVTRHRLIVSSLFTRFDVDAKIEVVDYTRPDGVREPEYYNVYSLRQFELCCAAQGFSRMISADFEMDVDMSPPASGGRGTYTRRLEDGRRLQFSGPLAMPWMFLAVEKNG